MEKEIRLTIRVKDWSNLEYEDIRKLEESDQWQYSGKLELDGKQVLYLEGASVDCLASPINRYLDAEDAPFTIVPQK